MAAVLSASPSADLHEPLTAAVATSQAPFRGGPRIPRGCARCLWSASKKGLVVFAAHPRVLQALTYAGAFFMIVFLDMEEEQASLLMAILVVGSVLILLCLRKAVDRMIALEGPVSWEGVRQADADTRTIAIENFLRANQRHQHQYPVQLAVLDVYSLDNPHLEENFRGVVADLTARDDPNINQLYHGTSAFAVRQVVETGFELPQHPGMFGKGVYFADTPLKSWQYSTIGFMLVCDVALGRERQALSGDRSLALETLGGEYDSVSGKTTAEGGTLRLPEWVVYRPAQAVPRLLLWVCKADTEEATRRSLHRDARVARCIADFIFTMFLSFFCSVFTVIVIGVVLSFD
eukprot:TRINITY_DN43669_c0_g1_i1.p1 TRINITY_DN43669_c0_g1~~TRINITY_DN43669_c0_g1_i1.p1  ORF type:complete len:348 (-),score=45.82 TRINITY_DN43669_c0_g1_i1:100-1143(-)